MRITLKTVLLSAAMLLATAMSPAADASTIVNFPMTNGGTGTGAGRVYTITVGATTVKVRVTAWSTASTSATSTVKKGVVQSYTYGLGDTSAGESTSSPNHTVDNLTQRDFLIFQFDQPVELESAKFTTYNMGSTRTDGDATIAFGTSNVNWQSDPLASTTTYAQLAAAFGNSFTASNVASTTGQTSTTRLLNPANSVGNIWLIGAAFNNPAENCGSYSNKACLDGFKLSQLTVRTAVPEPASWLMMIFGFGAIGFGMRRRGNAGKIAAA